MNKDQKPLRKIEKRYKRNCVNCLDHKDCKDEPSNKYILRRYREWCGKFRPNYDRIDHKPNTRKDNMYTEIDRLKDLGKEIDEVVSEVERVLGG